MIRRGDPRDEDDLVRMRTALWTDEPADEARVAARALLSGETPYLLPAVVLVAEVGGEVVGFAEIALRSFVDGCAIEQPVGYLEGWYVDPRHRGTGFGRALVAAAEDWCRNQGCREMGSDTWIDSEASRQAHRALGFEEVDLCVNYRKAIEPTPESSGETYYGPDLAAIHHAHYGQVAADAAAELSERLAAAGIDRGTVVDLAAGSGILSRRMVDEGLRAYGVDLSAAMLHIARDLVPEARFVEGSLWSAKLPEETGDVVAVAAIGEAFCYATDPAAGQRGLRRRLASIYRALAPGGLLLFDVAGPGRSGPTGFRERCFRHGETVLRVEEREADGYLTRDISTFLPLGRLYRRDDESHRLVLYEPDAVEAALTEAGFAWERLTRYRETELPPGWSAFAARKQD